MVGLYKNNGREWQRKGEPERVDVHDFPDPEFGKVIPYGVFDIRARDEITYTFRCCIRDAAPGAIPSQASIEMSKLFKNGP